MFVRRRAHHHARVQAAAAHLGVQHGLLHGGRGRAATAVEPAPAVASERLVALVVVPESKHPEWEGVVRVAQRHSIANQHCEPGSNTQLQVIVARMASCLYVSDLVELSRMVVFFCL